MDTPSAPPRNRKVSATATLGIGALITLAACAPAVTDASSTTAASSVTPTTNQSPAVSAAPIIIGVEYVVLDNPGTIERQAEMLSRVGFDASKPLPEAFSWGNMQSGPEDDLDFSRLDDYVVAFQTAGFGETVLALKPHSTWASVDHSLLRSRNVAPKPEYRDDYEAWVTAIVERYDADGVDDMPGLLRPIRYYEVGSEFSSYEPEPVDDYLTMLEIAYAAAHAAYPEVRVTHAAFLLADFLLGDPALESLDDDDVAIGRYGPHTFSEMRAILDHPELFDLLNVHVLAHSGEIEQLVRWLDWEMELRGYRKSIIISDTSINPFVAFGPAIDCERAPALMGIMFYPATEQDRCRIASYFNRVLGGDRETVEWLRAYAAADMVKKVVIAAEQRIELIDTAFTGDLPILNTRLGQAAAGNAAWGGMIDIASDTAYPSFYAMQQLIRHIDGYTAVERLDVGGPEGTRVYEFVVGGEALWVAWYDPSFLVLHPDPGVEVSVVVPTGSGTVTVERMISAMRQSEPGSAVVEAGAEGAEVVLDQTPVFIWLSG